MHGYKQFIEYIKKELYENCIDVFGVGCVEYDDFKDNIDRETFYLSRDSDIYKYAINKYTETLLSYSIFKKTYKKYIDDNKLYRHLFLGEFGFFNSTEFDSYSEYINIEIRKQKISKLMK